MYVDMGFETLHLKLCELKLWELIVDPGFFAGIGQIYLPGFSCQEPPGAEFLGGPLLSEKLTPR